MQILAPYAFVSVHLCLASVYARPMFIQISYAQMNSIVAFWKNASISVGEKVKMSRNISGTRRSSTAPPLPNADTVHIHVSASSHVLVSKIEPCMFQCLSPCFSTSTCLHCQWGVRCEVGDMRCEVWGVWCEVWGVKTWTKMDWGTENWTDALKKWTDALKNGLRHWNMDWITENILWGICFS